MKALLFSDLHAHEFPDFATVDPATGLNSRLMEAVRFVKLMKEEAQRRKIKLVIFLGDLFHVRGVVRVPVLQVVHAAFRDLATAAKVVVLVGNHDQTERKGKYVTPSVFAGPNIRVIGGYTTLLHRGIGYFGYHADPALFRLRLEQAYKNGARTLFVHAGIHGATTGPRDYVPTEEIAPEEFKKFRMVFSGHYHKHQQIGKNIVYVGAAMQHYRSETGYKTGFLIYDFERNEWEHHRVPTPQFVRWEGKDEVDVRGSYVDAVLPKGWTVEQLKTHLASAKSVNVLLPSRSNQRVTEQRLHVDSSTDIAVMVERYAKRFRGDLNYKKLVRVGLATVASPQLTERKR